MKWMLLKSFFIFGLVSMFLFSISGCDIVKEFFGIKTGTKNHIDVCVDITLADGLEQELEQDSAFVANIINHLGAGDLLHIYPIHKMAFIRQEKIFECEMPKEVGPAEGILKNNRNDALKKFTSGWKKGLQYSIKRGYNRATDLEGLFQHLQNHLQRVKAKKQKIIILSDMQDVAPHKWNFERKAPDFSLLQKWENEHAIANLKNTEVFIFRVYPAHHISKDHYLKIKKFWEQYFRKAGANLVCYQYERDLNLIFKEN